MTFSRNSHPKKGCQPEDIFLVNISILGEDLARKREFASLGKTQRWRREHTPYSHTPYNHTVTRSLFPLPFSAILSFLTSLSVALSRALDRHLHTNE